MIRSGLRLYVSKRYFSPTTPVVVLKMPTEDIIELNKSLLFIIVPLSQLATIVLSLELRKAIREVGLPSLASMRICIFGPGLNWLTQPLPS